ncbi:hypothetical protein HK101_005821 [Irineochytrium annulatum]|nr:hypothetical protein HK101_005821 [Irineochytrium annulatum]
MTNVVNYESVLLPTGVSVADINGNLTAQGVGLLAALGGADPGCVNAYTTFICSASFPRLPNCNGNIPNIGAPATLGPYATAPPCLFSNATSMPTPTGNGTGTAEPSPAGSVFQNGTCPLPLLRNPENATNDVERRFCLGSCCLPCPVLGSFYKPGVLENFFHYTSYLKVVSAIGAFLTFVSFATLPSKRRHPSAITLFFTLSVFLFTVFYIPFSLYGAQKTQCVDELTGANMRNSAACGVQGALLIYITHAVLMWSSHMILNMHLVSYMVLHFTAWGIPAILTAVPLAMKAIRFDYGTVCFVASDISNPVFFYPLSALVSVSFTLHVITIVYIFLKVFTKEVIQAESHVRAVPSSGVVLLQPVTSRARILRVMEVGWRSMTISLVCTLGFTFVWAFYFFDIAAVADVTQQKQFIRDWTVCLVQPGGSQASCAAVVAGRVPSMVWMLATDVLPSLVGVWVLFVLAARISVFREIAEVVFKWKAEPAMPHRCVMMRSKGGLEGSVGSDDGVDEMTLAHVPELRVVEAGDKGDFRKSGSTVRDERDYERHPKRDQRLKRRGICSCGVLLPVNRVSLLFLFWDTPLSTPPSPLSLSPGRRGARIAFHHRMIHPPIAAGPAGAAGPSPSNGGPGGSPTSGRGPAKTRAPDGLASTAPSFTSLLDFPTGMSPSPLPTLSTPNRLPAAGANSKLDLEPNPFEQSFLSSSEGLPIPEPPSGFGFSSSPKPILPPLTMPPNGQAPMASPRFSPRILGGQPPAGIMGIDRSRNLRMSFTNINQQQPANQNSLQQPPTAAGLHLRPPPALLTPMSAAFISSVLSERPTVAPPQPQPFSHPRPPQQGMPNGIPNARPLSVPQYQPQPRPPTAWAAPSNAFQPPQPGMAPRPSGQLYAAPPQAHMAGAFEANTPSPSASSSVSSSTAAAPHQQPDHLLPSQPQQPQPIPIAAALRASPKRAREDSAGAVDVGKRRKVDVPAAKGKKDKASARASREVSENPGSDGAQAWPGGSSVAGSEDDKRKTFLERNRQAALKCRQKKKEHTALLQQQVATLTEENGQLAAEANDLREQVMRIKAMLLQHRDCPVAIANGMNLTTIEGYQ